MKAILYEIQITEGALELSHGWSTTINEIYIPTFKIFINYKGAWKFHKGRYKNVTKIRELDIPILTCKLLADTVKYRVESEKIINKIIKDVVKLEYPITREKKK